MGYWVSGSRTPFSGCGDLVTSTMGAQEEMPDAEAIKTEPTQRSPSSESSGASPAGSEGSRGRKKERDRSITPKAEADGEHEKGGEDELSAGGKPRKRKRSRKGLEKNFPCPWGGCGKSYSRAEHLYRHQLNRMSYTCQRFSPAYHCL